MDERIDRVNKILVHYPRFQAILDKIEHCHKSSRYSAEPECLFVSGPTGAGKSTIRDLYCKRHPRVETSERTMVPVLWANIPAPTTVKSVVTFLLEKLGDPAAPRGSTTNQTLRLAALMKAVGVELVILDELQHFIDRESQRVLKTVSDWLKTLLNETRVPMVLLGLREAKGVFDVNEQLSRRFANRQELSPFGFNSDEEIKEFRKFLHAVDTLLPLETASGLANLQVARQLHYASDGVVHYVMKLIRSGTEMALRQGKPTLDQSILAEAFQSYVWHVKPHKSNPFIVPPEKWQTGANDRGGIQPNPRRGKGR